MANPADMVFSFMVNALNLTRSFVEHVVVPEAEKIAREAGTIVEHTVIPEASKAVAEGAKVGPVVAKNLGAWAAQNPGAVAGLGVAALGLWAPRVALALGSALTSAGVKPDTVEEAVKKASQPGAAQDQSLVELIRQAMAKQSEENQRVVADALAGVMADSKADDSDDKKKTDG